MEKLLTVMKKYSFEDVKRKNLLLYQYIRGSHAYGLNTEDSDVDEGGIFLSPSEQLLGLGLDYQEQIADDTNDVVWLELNKFMKLLLKSNPTVLEALFVPKRCVIYEHPIITKLKESRDVFVTKDCFKALGGYAYQQIKKCRGMHKAFVSPVTERLWPLDFCYTFHNQGSSKIRNWLEYRGLLQKYCGLVNIPNMHDVYGCYYDFGNHFLNEGVTCDDLIRSLNDEHEYDIIKIVRQINEEGRKDLNEELRNAQFKNMVLFISDFFKLEGEDDIKVWFNNLKPIGYSGIVGEDGKSNEIRLCSVEKGEAPICWISYNSSGYSSHCIDYKNYQDWVKHRNPVRYELNKGKTYDAKNVSHSFRLMQMCIEVAKGEGLKVDRSEIDREFLLKVKNHGFEYNEIISLLDDKKKEMDEAIANSTIPDSIDVDFVNDLLLDIRNKQLVTVKNDPINIPNICFTLDANNEEYRKQRIERGFDDTELWNLDSTILKFTLPRLKEFREQTICYPADLNSIEEWKDCLDKMINAIEEAINYEYNDHTFENLQLFHKYFMDLWW